MNVLAVVGDSHVAPAKVPAQKVEPLLGGLLGGGKRR